MMQVTQKVDHPAEPLVPRVPFHTNYPSHTAVEASL